MGVFIIIPALIAGLVWIFRNRWHELLIIGMQDLNAASATARAQVMALVKGFVRRMAQAMSQVSLLILAIGIVSVGGMAFHHVNTTGTLVFVKDANGVITGSEFRPDGFTGTAFWLIALGLFGAWRVIKNMPRTPDEPPHVDAPAAFHALREAWYGLWRHTSRPTVRRNPPHVRDVLALPEAHTAWDRFMNVLRRVWHFVRHTLWPRLANPVAAPTPFTSSAIWPVVFGFAAFFAGETIENGYLAGSGATTVISLIVPLAYVLSVLVWLLVQGVRISEFTGDRILDVAEAFDNVFAKLKPAHKDVNIFVEQRMMPAYWRFVWRIVSLFGILFMFGIHFPSLATMWIVGTVVGFTTWLAWANLRAGNIDIQARQVRSALVVEMIAYALVAYTLVKTLAPGLVAWVESFFADVAYGRRRLFFLDAVMSGVGLVLAVLAVSSLLSWKAEPNKIKLLPKIGDDGKETPQEADGLPWQRWVRNSLVFGCIVLATYFAAGVAVFVLSRGGANQVSVNGLSASTMPAPDAHVEFIGGRPHIQLAWKEVPHEKGTHIEWRDADATSFTEYTSLASGVNHLEMAKGVETGKTYYIRMLAVNGDGSLSEPSAEVKVSVSKALVPAASASVTGSAKAAKSLPPATVTHAVAPTPTVALTPPTPCSNGACNTQDGPAMAELRREEAAGSE